MGPFPDEDPLPGPPREGEGDFEEDPLPDPPREGEGDFLGFIRGQFTGTFPEKSLRSHSMFTDCGRIATARDQAASRMVEAWRARGKEQRLLQRDR